MEPLTGGEVGDLTALFAEPAATRLTGPDRATLVDEGLPLASGDVTATTATATLTALADQAGTVVLVAAGLALEVEAEVEGGTLVVRRGGELVLAPTSEGWRIAGYDMAVQRDGPGLDPATTTTAEVTP
ncbi:MAG: hypothetical protein M5U14_18515 [Acidimicrobiia bacterium]|nr:hypothetical protein [Acidimicrobiia bacterium]